jgi:hypothetical protein
MKKSDECDNISFQPTWYCVRHSNHYRIPVRPICHQCASISDTVSAFLFTGQQLTVEKQLVDNKHGTEINPPILGHVKSPLPDRGFMVREY